MNELFKEILGDDIDVFIAEFGGTTLEIPKRPSRKLLNMLGDKAWGLCRAFGGENVYVAKMHDEKIQALHNDFYRAVDYELSIGITRGEAIERQAKRFGWTTRWGQKLFKRHELQQPRKVKISNQLDFNW